MKRLILIIISLIALSALADNTNNKYAPLANGLIASNAISELTAILAQVPQGDTILDISFISPTEIHVKVCGDKTTAGCRRVYNKSNGQWVPGLIAHWKTFSQQSGPGYPPQGVGSPDP